MAENDDSTLCAGLIGAMAALLLQRPESSEERDEAMLEVLNQISMMVTSSTPGQLEESPILRTAAKMIPEMAKLDPTLIAELAEGLQSQCGNCIKAGAPTKKKLELLCQLAWLRDESVTCVEYWKLYNQTHQRIGREEFLLNMHLFMLTDG